MQRKKTLVLEEHKEKQATIPAKARQAPRNAPQSETPTQRTKKYTSYYQEERPKPKPTCRSAEQIFLDSDPLPDILPSRKKTGVKIPSIKVTQAQLQKPPTRRPSPKRAVKIGGPVSDDNDTKRAGSSPGTKIVDPDFLDAHGTVDETPVAIRSISTAATSGVEAMVSNINFGTTQAMHGVSIATQQTISESLIELALPRPQITTLASENPAHSHNHQQKQ
ncbi:hypothetical protein BJ878DRAFT_546064 [Calycina marina]|uniref:Uncharacterized protein n=1 Tax=Calycina marina TaxID=1763456 RepID=A0A9P7YWX9_9HELO|nr:hypothetical protein BJ878DRAFT_546064 [Calycina marina]